LQNKQLAKFFYICKYKHITTNERFIKEIEKKGHEIVLTGKIRNRSRRWTVINLRGGAAGGGTRMRKRP
jgi:hypothetical protein